MHLYERDGIVTVYFKLNGQGRSVDIKDISIKVDTVENHKIDKADDKQIGAPLQGMLSSILVKKGEKVAKNQPLFIIEAMKMETTITANSDTTVKKIVLKTGFMVNSDDLVIVLD